MQPHIKTSVLAVGTCTSFLPAECQVDSLEILEF